MPLTEPVGGGGTVVSGQFNANITNLSAPVAGTFEYTQIGRVTRISALTPIVGVSTVNPVAIQGIPPALRPSGDRYGLPCMVDHFGAMQLMNLFYYATTPDEFGLWYVQATGTGGSQLLNFIDTVAWFAGGNVTFDSGFNFIYVI